jgi:predicted DNA-binding transcriptional regulator AlpA
MTKDLLQKLEQAFSNNLSDQEACLYVGISTSTLYNYCKRNRTFLERKELLKKTPWIKAKLNIVGFITSENTKEKSERIKVSQWYLERTNKEEFSPRVEQKIAEVESLWDSSPLDQRLEELWILSEKKSLKDAD